MRRWVHSCWRTCRAGRADRGAGSLDGGALTIRRIPPARARARGIGSMLRDVVNAARARARTDRARRAIRPDGHAAHRPGNFPGNFSQFLTSS